MAHQMVEAVDPEAAWSALTGPGQALLIDVRSRAEWTFVGLPDLSSAGASPTLIEWQSFPTMTPNPGFTDAVLAEVERNRAEEVFFICRSGVRSMHAALATVEALDAADGGAEAAAGPDRRVRCVNVAEGFEGDLDAAGKRGVLNGWKARGLPWRQS